MERANLHTRAHTHTHTQMCTHVHTHKNIHPNTHHQAVTTAFELYFFLQWGGDCFEREDTSHMSAVWIQQRPDEASLNASAFKSDPISREAGLERSTARNLEVMEAVSLPLEINQWDQTGAWCHQRDIYPMEYSCAHINQDHGRVKSTDSPGSSIGALAWFISWQVFIYSSPSKALTHNRMLGKSLSVFIQ